MHISGMLQGELQHKQPVEMAFIELDTKQGLNRPEAVWMNSLV